MSFQINSSLLFKHRKRTGDLNHLVPSQPLPSLRDSHPQRSIPSHRLWLYHWMCSRSSSLSRWRRIPGLPPPPTPRPTPLTFEFRDGRKSVVVWRQCVCGGGGERRGTFQACFLSCPHQEGVYRHHPPHSQTEVWGEGFCALLIQLREVDAPGTRLQRWLLFRDF